ncbi:MAG TPA: transcription termination factor Rho [Lachnoclostridium phytofermentans]|uniref:Transcription termination factor Rho n=2 Tax=Lachnoclostridium TaxID=1506553 RepID=A0A3D2X712_9FIRM|nr:transcription termination factor Rho [Lachnoclostridium sp.]HCL02684.1 transcription termination factor Rho [Lachnoclostridium phytofermentans]
MSNLYETKSLSELRDIAKDKGMKSISALRKQELIDALNALEKGQELVASINKSTDDKPIKLETEEVKMAAEGIKQSVDNRSMESSHMQGNRNNVIRRLPEQNRQHELVKVPDQSKGNDNSRMSESYRSNEGRSMDNRNLENRSNDNKSNDNRNNENRNNENRSNENRSNENRNNENRSNENRSNENRNNENRSNENRNNENRSNENRNNEMLRNYDNNRRTMDNRRPMDNRRLNENRGFTESDRVVRINPTGDISGNQATELGYNTTSSSDRFLSQANQQEDKLPIDMEQLDSGETKEGILEVLSDGYGFIRCDNFLPGENDVYVSPAQIRRFNLKTGDIIVGNTRIRNQNEKFSALLYIKFINGLHPSEAVKRKKFEDLTPIFPNERIHLETPGCQVAMRMVDLISPIGKGQRGMIVSQPKTGKTTLLKQVAKAITRNHPEMHLIILLIDERPEEVTDIKESIEGGNVEVIYSTFDELPENHKRVSEMVIERAKRLVEHKKDVVILLDSITRLARAYNLTVQASGRTLSGGLDPAALHMPKKFFGAARNMREGGSLTILATALVETGSRMDDVVFEEFKGTGNMELVLDRNLSEKRIFPAIDLPKSSTRRDDLLLNPAEVEANYLMRKALNGLKSEDAVERIIQMFVNTKNNAEFVEMIKKTKI